MGTTNENLDFDITVLRVKREKASLPVDTRRSKMPLPIS